MSDASAGVVTSAKNCSGVKGAVNAPPAPVVPLAPVPLPPVPPGPAAPPAPAPPLLAPALADVAPTPAAADATAAALLRAAPAKGTESSWPKQWVMKAGKKTRGRRSHMVGVKTGCEREGEGGEGEKKGWRTTVHVAPVLCPCCKC